MRINADDAAGQRVVSLVRELVQGELGRILTTMSRPQPARPRRVTPEGRDLDAEDEVRTRIRAGAQAPLPHPQTAPQPATGQGYNAMIGEFARQMGASWTSCSNFWLSRGSLLPRPPSTTPDCGKWSRR